MTQTMRVTLVTFLTSQVGLIHKLNYLIPTDKLSDFDTARPALVAGNRSKLYDIVIVYTVLEWLAHTHSTLNVNTSREVPHPVVCSKKDYIILKKGITKGHNICDRLCENRPSSHLAVIRETLV